MTLIARNRAGDELCRGTFTIQPANWYKAGLADSLPCLAGKPGTLEVLSERGNVAAMLFLMTLAGGAISVDPSATGDNLTDLWGQLKKRAGITWPF